MLFIHLFIILYIHLHSSILNYFFPEKCLLCDTNFSWRLSSTLQVHLIKEKIHYFKWELCLKIFSSCMFLCTTIIILCKEYVTVFLFFSECFCRAEKPWSYLLRKYSSTGYLQAFIHVYDLKFHDIDDDDDS